MTSLVSPWSVRGRDEEGRDGDAGHGDPGHGEEECRLPEWNHSRVPEKSVT